MRRYYLEPLLLVRKAVPLPARVRRPAPANGAMDRDRLRCARARRKGKTAPTSPTSRRVKSSIWELTTRTIWARQWPPAAVDTITTHFEDTGLAPSYYDLIVTGDLATVGADIACDLICASGFDVRKNYDDCGKMVFDVKEQDVHSGGSGCGCSGIVFAATS